MTHKSNYSMKIIKVLHIFLIIILSSAILTAIFNTTLLSKSSIMDLISYALDTTGAEMSPVDSIFVARVIRQQLWQVHYYLGATLPFLLILFYWIRAKGVKFKATASVSINTYVIFYMSIIGTILYYRKPLELTLDSIDIFRELHWLGAYAIGISLICHLYEAFKQEVNR